MVQRRALVVHHALVEYNEKRYFVCDQHFVALAALFVSATSVSMAAASINLSAQERFELITRDLQEVLGGDAIKAILDKDERPVRMYWGTAPTGRPHIGYLVPLTKVADFLRAGVEVKVLLAGE